MSFGYMRDLTERLEQKDGSTPDDLTNHIRAILPGTAGSNTPHIRSKCRAVRGRQGSSRAWRPGQERRPANDLNPRDRPGSRRTSCILRTALKLAEDCLHARFTRCSSRASRIGPKMKNAARSGGQWLQSFYSVCRVTLPHRALSGSSHRALFRVGWTAPFGAL